MPASALSSSVVDVITLPLWAVFAVSFGSPALAFAGVLVAQWIGRRTARELEIRSRREETMRTLRWAAELAIDDDAARSRLGSSQLATLGRSALLDVNSHCSSRPLSRP